MLQVRLILFFKHLLYQKHCVGNWGSRYDYNFFLSIIALNVHCLQRICSLNVRYVRIELSAIFGSLVEQVVLKP